MVVILAVIQLMQIIFPALGWDKNKYYVSLMKNIRALSLRGKGFKLSVKKSYYYCGDNENYISQLKDLLKTNLAEFNPKIVENGSLHKISALIKRFDFDIDVTIYFHEDEENPWILIDQSMVTKFNKVQDALNTIFNNLNRFNSPIISQKSDKVDVEIDADELKLFKVLLTEIGTCVIGNVSLIQNQNRTFIQIRDKPEVELAKKVKDFVTLGHV